MKKALLILACLAAWSVNPAFAAKGKIELGCQKIDNSPIGTEHSKAPLRIPSIYQDGYTLSLSTSHPAYIINIIQDGEVVYTSVIPEGVTEYELPGYLVGEYTIEFISGNYCFFGLIEL